MEHQIEKKKLLRKEILKQRNGLSREEQLTLSYEIMEQTVGYYEFLQAEEILLYASYQSEVITDGIMEYALLLGKKVYYPKVLSNEADSRMEFFQIFSKADFIEGYKGILEPKDMEERRFQPSDKKALLIMPGAAFDRKGHRIGYGKGFYDRFLEEKKECFSCKMALGYEIQLLEEIPFEEHDICVDVIVTEKEMVECTL